MNFPSTKSFKVAENYMMPSLPSMTAFHPPPALVLALCSECNGKEIKNIKVLVIFMPNVERSLSEKNL